MIQYIGFLKTFLAFIHPKIGLSKKKQWLDGQINCLTSDLVFRSQDPLDFRTCCCNCNDVAQGAHQENMKLLKFYLICLNPLKLKIKQKKKRTEIDCFFLKISYFILGSPLLSSSSTFKDN